MLENMLFCYFTKIPCVIVKALIPQPCSLICCVQSHERPWSPAAGIFSHRATRAVKRQHASNTKCWWDLQTSSEPSVCDRREELWELYKTGTRTNFTHRLSGCAEVRKWDFFKVYFGFFSFLLQTAERKTTGKEGRRLNPWAAGVHGSRSRFSVSTQLLT